MLGGHSKGLRSCGPAWEASSECEEQVWGLICPWCLAKENRSSRHGSWKNDLEGSSELT